MLVLAFVVISVNQKDPSKSMEYDVRGFQYNQTTLQSKDSLDVPADGHGSR
jgi:hypothetical protein